MQYHAELTEDTVQKLRCPVCRSKLRIEADQFLCSSPKCQNVFPIVGGIPILINEGNSLFSISEIAGQSSFLIAPLSKFGRFVKKILPDIQRNLKVKENLRQFVELLFKETPNPKVLIVGGRIIGQGMQHILSNSSIQFVESDVSFGPRTALIFDAHDIPFNDETFDGVITQVTLEHVIDPYRCVEEIHRVLKKNGIVYADIPFMEPVHGSKYDFTRFSHLGCRRLFRSFDEISSGAAEGPGMMLAWAYLYFLLSFTESKLARYAIKVFVRLTAFWLKYVDYYLIDKQGALDAALVYYFMCRKSDRIISDREILEGYRGACMD